MRIEGVTDAKKRQTSEYESRFSMKLAVKMAEKVA